MNRKARLFGAAAVFLLLAALVVVALRPSPAQDSSEPLFSTRTTIRLWYQDDSLTDFFSDAAAAYNQSHRQARVVPTLVTDTDYVQKLYDASVEGDEFPDVFVAENGDLGRLYKAGLAAEVTGTQYFANTNTFPQSAIDAVTCNDLVVAYPLCFETSAFLYNTDYLQSMADSLGQSLTDTVPKTMLDVIRLANGYDAPEGVSAVMKWDVSDIFYNYCFVGAYLDVGGPDGDDPDSLELYNSQLIQCLQVYQQMNQYFAIDSKTDDYDSVLQSFEDGSLVFMLATTGAVQDIRDKIADGSSTIHYGVATIPDSTDSLQTKTMSVTDCLVVNGYSEHQDLAEDFIQYVLDSQMDSFYDTTGMPAAKSGITYSDEHMDGFVQAYADSVPVTKLREASNFWMLLEETFQDVWDGTDCNDALHDLAQKVMIQISGTENYKVDKIADPEPIDITADLSYDADSGGGDTTASTESSTEAATESATEAATEATTEDAAAVDTK